MQKEPEKEVELPLIENPKNNNKKLILIIGIILVSTILVIAGFLIYDYFSNRQDLPIIPVNYTDDGLINDSDNQNNDNPVVNLTNLTDDQQQGPSSSSSGTGSGGPRPKPDIPLPQTSQTYFDGWRALIVKDKYESENNILPGEGVQYPQSMVRSLYNTDYIYWAHDCGQGWRSRDNGQTWERFLGKGLGLSMGQSIQVDPFDPNIVFIAVDNLWMTSGHRLQGLYKSTDGGDNWRFALPVNFTEGHRLYRQNIAYDLNSSIEQGAKIWYAAFANAQDVINRTDIYKSEDFGDTWNIASTLNAERVYALYVHPNESSKLYLATSSGLFYSPNSGVSWQTLGDLPAGEVSSIQINMKEPNMIYATILGNGSYKSIDGGTTFSLLKSSQTVVGIFINQGFPEVIYIMDEGYPDVSYPKVNYPQVSLDSGQTWNRLNPHPRTSLGREKIWGNLFLAKSKMGAIVPDTRDKCGAVGYAESYLWKTQDCFNFSHANNLFSGYVASCQNAIIFDESNPDKFAISALDIGLLITENNGEYFEVLHTNVSLLEKELGYFSDANDIKAGLFIPGTTKVIVSAGQARGKGITSLIYTENISGPWRVLEKTRGAYRKFFVDKENPNLVYTYRLKSIDGGRTFSNILYLVDNNAEIIAMCGVDSKILYAMNSTSGQEIYRSDDFGQTWRLHINKRWFAYSAGASNVDELVFALDPQNCDAFYSLYEGQDLAYYNGSDWKKLGLLEKIRQDNPELVRVHDRLGYPAIGYVLVDPNNNSVIYATTSHAGVSAVYRSIDKGTSWEDISYNLPRQGYGAALSISPHSGEVFVSGCSGTWVFPAAYPSKNGIYNNSVSKPSCSDGLKNGDESDVDEGGRCRAFENAITQYGITWFFDKPLTTESDIPETYQYGKFVNGDYWVVGPANITKIEPKPNCSAGNGRNGTMINPRVKYIQGFDARAVAYNKSFCYEPSFMVNPRDSIISSISLLSATSYPYLSGLSVLTIVDAPQSPDKFRPPYSRPTRAQNSANDELIFSLNNVHWEHLPQIPKIPGTPNINDSASELQKMSIEFFPSWAQRDIAPASHPPVYGRNTAWIVGDISMQLMLNYTNEEKKIALVNLMQYGIDLYGTYLDGKTWESDGGIFCGRKWPLLFTGIMFNNEIKNIPWNSQIKYSNGVSSNIFHEDGQTFYVNYSDIYLMPYQLNSWSDWRVSRAGNASVTNGSNIATGIGTTWESNDILQGESVFGDNGQNYTCIRKHVSNYSTRPVLGSEWQNYWVVKNNAYYPKNWTFNKTYIVGYFGIENDSYDSLKYEGHAYEIISIIDDTHLELDSPYRGKTDSSGKAKFKYGNWFVWYGHGNAGKLADFLEYTDAHKGLPEWGIEHDDEPSIDGLDWDANYRRCCNAGAWAGIELAILMMQEKTGSKTLWNHSAYFDFQDRYMEVEKYLGNTGTYTRQWRKLSENMWDRYRKDYGCFWTRDNKADIYSQGYYDCAGQNITCASNIGGNTCTNKNCVIVSTCTDYPNARAFDYDPCNLKCEGEFDSGQLTSLKANPSSFFSSIMNWFKGILTGNTIKGITGNFFKNSSTLF